MHLSSPQAPHIAPTEAIRQPLLDLARLAQPGIAVLVARAAKLQGADGSSTVPASLRSRNVAVVSTGATDDDVELVRASGAGLGAKVATINPDTWPIASATGLQSTARLLGRLYDMVICLGVPPAIVVELQIHAGVPVFDGVAGWDDSLLDPTRLPIAGHPELNRRLLVQAALLNALGDPT